jgi:hypothetical protein
LGHHINFEFHFLYTFFRLFFSFLYIYIYREKVNQKYMKYIYIFLINFLPGGQVFGQLYMWCSMVFDDPNLVNQKCLHSLSCFFSHDNVMFYVGVYPTSWSFFTINIWSHTINSFGSFSVSNIAFCFTDKYYSKGMSYTV